MVKVRWPMTKQSIKDNLCDCPKCWSPDVIEISHPAQSLYLMPDGSTVDLTDNTFMKCNDCGQVWAEPVIDGTCRRVDERDTNDVQAIPSEVGRGR